MQEIKKIGILQTAKIIGLFGLLMGIISVVLSKILCSTNLEIAAMAGLQCESLTPGGIITGIIAAGVIYFIVGLNIAALYNVFAKWIGGITVELTEPRAKQKKKK